MTLETMSGVMLPQAKEDQWPPEVGNGKEQILSERLVGLSANTLILPSEIDVGLLASRTSVGG